MSPKLDDELRAAVDVLCNFPNLKYACLHLPFRTVNFQYMWLDHDMRAKFVDFLLDCADHAKALGVDIDVLSHITYTVGEFNTYGGFEMLETIDSLLEGTRVTFLLENSIINLSESSKQNIYDYVFSSTAYKNIKFCWDICHHQVSENVMWERLSLHPGLVASMKNIHFACTLDGDGYRDRKRTHGRGHPNYEAVCDDLAYIVSYGVDLSRMNIVAEISEDDYVERPDLRRELEYLQRALSDRRESLV